MKAFLCKLLGHLPARHDRVRDWRGRIVDMFHCPRCGRTWTLDE